MTVSILLNSENKIRIIKWIKWSDFEIRASCSFSYMVAFFFFFSVAQAYKETWTGETNYGYCLLLVELHNQPRNIHLRSRRESWIIKTWHEWTQELEPRSKEKSRTWRDATDEADRTREWLVAESRSLGKASGSYPAKWHSRITKEMSPQLLS